MSSLIDPPVDDTYRSLGYALKRAQQALRGHLDNELRNIGLTTPQYSVLAGLEFNAGLSSAELARRAFVTAQTMQSIIATLERDGLVKRTAHPVHGRVLTTELTPDGRSALRAAHEIVAKAEALTRDAVAPGDPEVIYAALLRIAEAMR
ncbi:MarR family transcriptional regulator [Sinorhizobium sp. B11]|jgi:DNA-binding MarR family transcriptional regulator|uniref:MarR family winged helix-turn-helix transcriptional regulator n=1 Tax=unclassified Rhizobium TaxID=2613769 RepID=UPI000DD66993|nr:MULTISPECIES: MarR family transcriptional regulator [unclassified Rhizobium]MBB3441107.1 DNA-binding MarR family transcriptional regulator [Rhizobium sp. BK379]MBB3559969.1 DNA-binding MarR family transcriptional regulator [Rhizobium sp. BK512]